MTLIAPEHERQVEAARLSRAYLALLKCQCRTCAPEDIEECAKCGHFRPRCRTMPHRDAEGGSWRICLGGCR